MSESPNMSLLGSKEENNRPKNDDSNKEESPERYAPYSADSDSETYDTEALSIMDINDIIGVQSEPVGDSTLESEFAALSEIITDSQPDSTNKSIECNSLETKNVTPSIVNAEEIKEIENKLDKNNAVITEINFCAKNSSNQASKELQFNVNDKNKHSNSLDTCKVDEKAGNDDNVLLYGETKENYEEKSNDEKNEENEIKDSDLNSDLTEVGGISKSLQLIGEAYISEDSQGTDSDELQIGKEPKIVYSCKPLVDKHLCKSLENDSINRNISVIDSSINIPTLDNKLELSVDDRPIDDVSSIVENILLQNDSSKVVADQINDELTDSLQSKEISNENLDETDNLPMKIDDDDLLKCEENSIKTEDLIGNDKSKPSSSEISAPSNIEVTNDECTELNDVDNKIDDEKISEIMVNAQVNAYEKNKEKEDLIEADLLKSEDELNSSSGSEKESENVGNLIEGKQKEIIDDIMDIDEEVDELITDINEESEKKLEDTIEKITPQQERIETEKDISHELEKQSLDHVNDENNCAVVRENEQLENTNSVTKNNESENNEKNKQELSKTNEEERSVKLNTDDNFEPLEDELSFKTIDVSEQSENLLNEINLKPILEEKNITPEVNDLNEVIDDIVPVCKEDTATVIAVNLPETSTVDLNKICEQEDKQLINELTELDEMNSTVIEKEETMELVEEIKMIPEEILELPDRKPEEIIEDKLNEAQDELNEAHDELKTIPDLDEKSSEALIHSETLPLDLNELEMELSLKSESLPEKLKEAPLELENDNPLDELLGLDLMKTDESLMQVDKPINNDEIVPVENEEKLIDGEKILPTHLILQKSGSNQENKIYNENLEIPNDSGQVSMDVDEIKDNKILEKSIEEIIDEKNIQEVVKENEEFEKIVTQLNVEESEQQELNTTLNLHEKDKLKAPTITDSLIQIDSGIELLQSNLEISELESAVKFLQESEEHDIELPVILSPKKLDDKVSSIEKQESPNLFPSTQDMCEDSEELAVELDSIINQDAIAISEAEIINEAAKLENEKKQLNEAQVVSNQYSNRENDESDNKQNIPNSVESSIIKEKEALKIPTEIELKQGQNSFTTKTIIPKISILEERLKIPPKIEIPITEPRISNTPSSPKTSLLIQRDAKMMNYQKMLDSPKISTEKSREDSKLSDSSKKDVEKHDFENAGSPRIILKIAKSALADCGEPRSPKSPKIRSATNSPNPEDSPGQKLGKIKLKLSKGCHPAIINENNEEPTLQWHTESSSSLSPLGMKIKLSKSGDASIIQSEKFDNQEDRRLDSPLGMKIKLSKTGDAAIVQDKDIKLKTDLLPSSPKRTESPLGMKIKLLKTGDASIIQSEKQELENKQDKEVKSKEKVEVNQEGSRKTDSPLGMKIKLFKTGDASILSSDYDEGNSTKIKEKSESREENIKRVDSPIGMKIKLSKKGGGASIISPDNNSGDINKDKLEIPEVPKRTDSPLGMKIKLSKTGDASIIYSEIAKDQQEKEELECNETSSSSESSSSKDMECDAVSTNKLDLSIGMKIKLSKDGDATIVHPEKKEEEQDLKQTDSSIGMKIKLSKTGDASIVQPQTTEGLGDSAAVESMKIKLSKSGHPTIVTNESEIIQNKDVIEDHIVFQKQDEVVNRSEPVHLLYKHVELSEIATKRKDNTSSPLEVKKSKLDGQLTEILPEVTIQPITNNRLDYNQVNVKTVKQDTIDINHDITITQMKLNKSIDNSMGEKLKNMMVQPVNQNNSSDDCEIIEHRPELIIVNENSNSSQDVMIIEEVTPVRVPDIKLPKKRGRPRRNPIVFPPPEVPQDPLAFDDPTSMEPRENERPKRTCRNLKSYAPPKRGRGRGRGKRKYERIEPTVCKRPRLDKSFTEIENSTTALITLDEETTSTVQNESPELYKALKQPSKGGLKEKVAQTPVKCTVNLSDSNVDNLIDSRVVTRLENDSIVMPKASQVRVVAERLTRAAENIKESKDHSFGNRDQNWLTPILKKQADNSRSDNMSMVQVIDEETRMSAECLSRSQTPARSIPINETPVNEESQGSVVSTATTESEKVKVKNRRMEINFDPDEGPFTVDKIAEYEWPPERKGETFMIQEQISQYLGVKSFKRKYPELKRRVVEMEERNYLRENGLVNEAMCDMGLTAICSSEVLDIMCGDFPDHYEEYRKHMRERQIKEHSKKQKELTAAATAEKNRIDLAEMAVQSAVSWNVSLNKARRETRKCSLDLQTFTIHVPKKQQRINEESKVSHYPVALIPGQYTDYYREYTPAELRYYPLNTVLYGPMRPNERKFDSQSEGSQSDSDSDSSSDDSSCSSSEGTQDTEESQSTMEDVDIELSNQKDKSLKCKMCLKNLNKNTKPEVLIQCGTCNGHVHPSCIDLTLDMVPHIQAYAWQCTDCKTCAQCHDPADEDKMLFCDMCDRGYHIYCVGLRRVPQGRWHCQECAICASCGSREAGGINAERNSVAQWQHEYKKGDKNTRVYVSTLCVPCSKLWRKGRYCPHCSRCHTVQRLDLEENLVHCSACDKYLHLECVENKDLKIDKKNYQCEICMQNRQRTTKTSASKVIRA